jgi:hypothetical protein|tara:strand:- start:5300 stop:5491 length:192 start_codon:yes stop_codon:yes gene_type:complete
MEEDKNKEIKAALDTLFAAAGMARLSRDEHAAVQQSGQKLMEFISKCTDCDSAQDVEVVKEKK